MRGHIDLIRLQFHNASHHVISISETWLHEGVSDALVGMDEYFLIRNDRLSRAGGGVACYIHKSLKATVIAASSSNGNDNDINSPEFLIIEIRLPLGEAVLFASIYRRPKGHLFHDFVDKLTAVSHRYKNIVIGGDLNCNLLMNNFEANYLRELASSLSLHIVPSEATHHTSISDSWLDVLIIDNPDKILSFTKSPVPFIAGHDLLHLSLSFHSKPNITRSMVRRCFRDINRDKFLSFILEKVTEVQSEFDSLSDGVDVSRLCKLLSGTLLEALDVFAPAREIVTKRSPIKWLLVQLKARLKYRNLLYKQAKRSGSLLGFARYRLFRNQLNADIKRAKAEFLFTSLNNITDPAKLWKELARLGLTKSNFVSPLHLFKSDELNSYYASVSSASPVSYHDFSSAITLISYPTSRPQLSFSTVSPSAVYKLIASRPPHSYASGFDGIPLPIIRMAWSGIALSLTTLFNH